MDQAKSFFDFVDETPNITISQVESGIKTLTLLYFNKSKDWTEFEVLGFVLVHRLAHKRLMNLKYSKVTKLNEIKKKAA